jgi:hypothetical protein
VDDGVVGFADTVEVLRCYRLTVQEGEAFGRLELDVKRWKIPDT